ncbi:MoaD/ThiS family protein [Geoalkalibacter halelectricus]|uniref:MoaD/ThiS family protein n=1 Tax=Geoalkalibacter halelectricus TaxID=2847045 RepID=UPI003D1FC21B
MTQATAKTSGRVIVRMFGALHSLRRSRNLPTTIEVDLPPEGCTALEIAQQLDLPLERIEAVFCNHRTYDLNHRIHPGDRIAFVPPGVPGPHRFYLGIHQAGKKFSAGEDH